MALDFDDADILTALKQTNEADLNQADFGIVKMNHDGIVQFYSDGQTTISSVAADHAKGKVFFTDVAPCTNNFLVSGVFESELTVDKTLSYVYTVKMKPTQIKIRLLKDSETQYLLSKLY